MAVPRQLIIYWFNILSTINKRDARSSRLAPVKKNLIADTCFRERVCSRHYVSTAPSGRILSVDIANYGLPREFESDIRLHGRIIIIIPRDTRHDSFVIGGRRIREADSPRTFLRMQLKRGNKLILFAAAPISHTRVEFSPPVTHRFFFPEET